VERGCGDDSGTVGVGELRRHTSGRSMCTVRVGEATVAVSRLRQRLGDADEGSDVSTLQVRETTGSVGPFGQENRTPGRFPPALFSAGVTCHVVFPLCFMPLVW
jgi:hypothetical protein